MAEEQVNQSESQVASLAVGIDADDVVVVVQTGEGARFTTSGTFRIVVDEEIMIATATTDDAISISERGAEGTNAQAHEIGAPVAQVLTAAGLSAEIDEHVATHEAAGDPHPQYAETTELHTRSHDHGTSGDGTSLAPTGTFRLNSVITPPEIDDDKSNYSPTGLGTSSIFAFTTDQDGRMIGSLASGAAGRVLLGVNVGAFRALFEEEDTGSTGANRIVSGSGNIYVDPGQSVLFIHVQSRWRAVAYPFPVSAPVAIADSVPDPRFPNSIAIGTGLTGEVEGDYGEPMVVAEEHAGSEHWGPEHALDGPEHTGSFSHPDLDDIDADGLHLPKRGRYKSGSVNYYNLPGVIVQTVGTATPGANKDRWAPFMVMNELGVDAIVIETTTPGSAGHTARLCIAKADTDWQPIETVKEIGPIAVDSTGVIVTTFTEVKLPPGRYLIGFNGSNGTAAYRTVKGHCIAGSPIVNLQGNPDVEQFVGSRSYAAFGSNPADWTDHDSNVSANGMSYFGVLRLSSVT